MALERQSIEKKDFPIGRRGYDPAAVDAHLRTLADEVEELKRSSSRPETLASSASEQIRSILEAAETSAAAIRRRAEDEASTLRSEANREAKSTRQETAAQAKDYLAKVSTATSSLLERLDGMESELNTLIGSLRGGGERLRSDLEQLGQSVVEMRDAIAPTTSSTAEAAGAEPVLSEPEGVEEIEELVELEVDEALLEEAEIAAAGAEAGAPTDEPPPADAGLEEEELEDDEEEPIGATRAAADVAAASPPPDGDDESEGARLIALNMALNGTPREETERYLAAHFELHDRARLLDEVYASVEG